MDSLKRPSHTVILLLLYVLAGTASVAAAQPPLRAALSQSWASPMLMAAPERQSATLQDVYAGLVPEIYRIIADRADAELQMTAFPRRRLDQAGQEGEIDLRCFSNPEWVAQPDQYLWSEGLFNIRNYVVGRGPYAEDSNRMIQGRIATVRGYYYRNLERLFDDGTLERVDTTSQESVMRMLVYGRVDIAVTDEFHYIDFIRREKENWPEEAFGTVLTVSSLSQFRCGVWKQSPYGAENLLRAVNGSRDRIREAAWRYLGLTYSVN